MDPRYKSPAANVDIEPEDDFRDLEGLSSVLRWMLLIGALFSALGVASSFMQYALLTQSFTPDQGRVNDMRELSVGGLTTLYFLATVIVFGIWIVRAHRNLPALGARYIEVTPGWAVGWFFVPVVNIWFPYRAMRWLWRGSHSTLKPELQDGTWVLPTWWGLWLACSFLPTWMSGMQVRARTIAGLVELTSWQIIARIMVLALYVVASILVMRIWEAQRTQHDNPGEFDPAPGFAD
jgi:hypothetical protein